LRGNEFPASEGLQKSEKSHAPSKEPPRVVVKVGDVRWPRGGPVLKGIVVGADGLIRSGSDGSDTYVKVKLKAPGVKVKKPPTSEVAHNTQDPKWNFRFNLGSAPLDGAVEFVVKQKKQKKRLLGDQTIGCAVVPISTIEMDNAEPKALRLVKPAGFKKPKSAGKGEVTNFGTLTVIFQCIVQKLLKQEFAPSEKLLKWSRWSSDDPRLAPLQKFLGRFGVKELEIVIQAKLIPHLGDLPFLAEGEEAVRKARRLLSQLHISAEKEFLPSEELLKWDNKKSSYKNFAPLDGIIAHLTRECGGNVHERGVSISLTLQNNSYRDIATVQRSARSV
jgi:hypothetical protein